MNRISERVMRETGVIPCSKLYLTIHLGWGTLLGALAQKMEGRQMCVPEPFQMVYFAQQNWKVQILMGLLN